MLLINYIAWPKQRDRGGLPLGRVEPWWEFCHIWLEETGLVRAYNIPGAAGLVKFFMINSLNQPI